MSKKELIETAKLAEQCERYDDMVDCMKKIIKGDGSSKICELTQEDRNLFSTAYKNVVGARRSAWRIASSLEQKKKDKGEDTSLVETYREKIEKELNDMCKEVIHLLDNDLINEEDKDTSALVFYLKMKGDYYRYMVEVALGSEREEKEKLSYEAYDKAYEKATQKMSPTDPIRLGLALNFSVFYYEIKNQPDKACKLAKKAFDSAVESLGNIKEDSYKDSTLIMQLLRDNLTLWTSEQEQEEKEQ